MKLYINNKFLDINNDSIKKLDYYFQDRAQIITQYKEELSKMDKLPDNVKNALDNISNMQELQLQQIKLYEEMKHAILKKHNVKIINFKFRV